MCCERPIKGFVEKLTKYEDSFPKGSSSCRSLRGVIQSVKVFPRKAAVLASEEVEKLRAGLEAPSLALGLMLSLEIRFVHGTPGPQICAKY